LTIKNFEPLDATSYLPRIITAWTITILALGYRSTAYSGPYSF